MTAPKWALPPVRTSGRVAPADLAARRAQMAPMAGGARPDEGVSARDATYGGVPCVVCEGTQSDCTIVYLHGGGYRLGSPAGWLAFASRLVPRSGARVVLPDYRLAPEQPFPAALYDAAAVYGELVARPGEPVVVGGDSAGAGLAAALVLASSAAGVAAPAGLLLLSPWVDLTVRSSTYESRNESDQVFSRSSAVEAAEMYLQGHDARDPLASPLFADLDQLARFPPTVIFAGGDEVLLEDAVAFASRLALANVSVQCHAVAGMQHVWPTIFADLPESELALDVMGRFVRQVAAHGGPAEGR